MAGNLPLIPQKGSVCGDVRPVLREVFRDRDYLPPLPTDKDVVLHDDPLQEHWIKNYSLECNELWRKEEDLKQEHARRIARDTLPNIYHLSAPRCKETPAWRIKHGLIARKDLIPAIHQNAGRDNSLWVKSILNRSSCDVSCMEVQGTRLQPPLRLYPNDQDSLLSMSIGEILVRDMPPPAPPSTPPLPQTPDYIVCIPSKLNFINFTVGRLHTQSIRLVNISKLEVRLSVRPPKRRELDVMLCSPRGLTVSAGAAAELRVRFTPSDVRAVTDTLLIRVSNGKCILVPIHCYIEPPVLEILVPNLTWSSLSCTVEEGGVRAGRDVLELGARLLGDVHCARLLLHCSVQHADFFVLTEDAWLSYCLDTLTCDGAVVCGPFTVSPVWWRAGGAGGAGGGAVRGGAWCRARGAGLQAAALRVVASTAVARPLHLLADALHFAPHHLTLEAHEKNYDICSDDDPACEYYVNLGTAFPNRKLTATVQLVNHSPVIYSYYWSVRPWGVCSCSIDQREMNGSNASEDESDQLCIGAIEARKKGSKTAIAALTRVEPMQGRVAPRSSCPLQVCVPDVGARLGVQRAVLMLILKDIPKESFPPNLDPMVVKTELVVADPIPGHEPWSREVCEVVCCQLEVWWEVVPVRFVLDPIVLPLPHSRRVKNIEVTLRATQLFGCDNIRASWLLPSRVNVPNVPPLLAPVHSHAATIKIPLPSLPNEYPATDVFVLNAANDEWQAQSLMTRRCATRHPGLRPASVWLGIVPPGAHMNADLQIHNDTHQHTYWWGSVWRWWGEREPSAQCLGRAACARCRQRRCSCALLRPARGALHHRQRTGLLYDVNAPGSDGCVATLLQVRRTAGDVGRVPGAAGTDARAALVAYRVLAPRLVLRALPCHGDKVPGECEGCCLDAGGGAGGAGGAVLRPSAALRAGRCSCYRLRLTNTTPLPTTVTWDEPIEKEGVIKVTFIPNDFDVGSYAQVEIRVVIKAQRVCGRRVYVYRAKVAYAYKPLYLLIDTAVAGLEVACEIPLGGGTKTDSTLIMRTTQKEQFPWEVPWHPVTASEAFLEEDMKRAVRTENICHCRYKMMYIPVMKPPRPPRVEGEFSSIEIITEPPPLSRVCACDVCTKPTLPDFDEPGCLQFKQLPLRTVRTRSLVVRNESVLTSQWQAAVRNWPRNRKRTLTADPWAMDVGDSGVALEVSPSSGVLGPRAKVQLTVSVYADCWGLYRDQILIMIDNLEPLVVDVWIEAVGTPLCFSMKPSSDSDDNLTLWMSTSDPNRIVRVKNTSRAELIVHSYVLLENEHPHDALPFRLYLRFYDVLPRTCPCVTASDSSEFSFGEESAFESIPEEMDTGVEVYLSADHGHQTDTYFKVEPEVATIAPGAHEHLNVTFEPPKHGEIAENAVLLLRILPVRPAGPCWFRREPRAQTVHLRAVLREGVLQVSDCKIQVKYCALGLPYGDVMRIRKTFHVLNVGNGHLHLEARTEGMWSIVQDHNLQNTCGSGCACVTQSGQRTKSVALHYQPLSSNEMTVEVCIHSAEVWPKVDTSTNSPPLYNQWKKTVTPLYFYDKDNVLLMTLSLILNLEYPRVNIEPAAIDFGFVTDGDTRKTYFTVSHTSRTTTLYLETKWLGSDDFSLWPKTLLLSPGTCEPVYVQYTARWRRGPVEGVARVEHCGGAGAGAGAGAGWCWSALPVRAAAARDQRCRAPPHDHTDDSRLLPPGAL